MLDADLAALYGVPTGRFNEAVRRNLEERRAPLETIERLDDAWDARLARSGGWRVFVRFNHRGKRRTAEWEFTRAAARSCLGARFCRAA